MKNLIFDEIEIENVFRNFPKDCYLSKPNERISLCYSLKNNMYKNNTKKVPEHTKKFRTLVIKSNVQQKNGSLISHGNMRPILIKRFIYKDRVFKGEDPVNLIKSKFLIRGLPEKARIFLVETNEISNQCQTYEKIEAKIKKCVEEGKKLIDITEITKSGSDGKITNSDSDGKITNSDSDGEITNSDSDGYMEFNKNLKTNKQSDVIYSFVIMMKNKVKYISDFFSLISAKQFSKREGNFISKLKNNKNEFLYYVNVLFYPLKRKGQKFPKFKENFMFPINFYNILSSSVPPSSHTTPELVERDDESVISDITISNEVESTDFVVNSPSMKSDITLSNGDEDNQMGMNGDEANQVYSSPMSFYYSSPPPLSPSSSPSPPLPLSPPPSPPLHSSPLMNSDGSWNSPSVLEPRINNEDDGLSVEEKKLHLLAYLKSVIVQHSIPLDSYSLPPQVQNDQVNSPEESVMNGPINSNTMSGQPYLNPMNANGFAQLSRSVNNTPVQMNAPYHLPPNFMNTMLDNSLSVSQTMMNNESNDLLEEKKRHLLAYLQRVIDPYSLLLQQQVQNNRINPFEELMMNGPINSNTMSGQPYLNSMNANGFAQLSCSVNTPVQMNAPYHPPPNFMNTINGEQYFVNMNDVQEEQTTPDINPYMRSHVSIFN
ncbi:hypothetical protein PIROE2DRAFT_60746 [Piromyces sp. E2]|nr:hypothetical protein PIROE2DRAFT_60746 [Piromyces sp. E2]|eukprot:OUM64284.1 hypothetical protein PIROE2DRAFT_60746 [Piromyces sp. E2]